MDFRALMAIRWKMDRVTFSTDYRPLFHRVRWEEVKQSSERERDTVEKRFISEILGWREEIAVMAGAPEIRIHRGGGELEGREIFLIS